MTPKQEAALRMAREALKESHPEAYRHTITAIDEALAEQPAQPCGYPYCGCNSRAWCKAEQQSGIKQVIELYDSPEQPAQQQKPVACKTLCELCVNRGYIKCANAAKTTPIPSPQPAQQQEPDKYLLEVECTKCGATEKGVLTFTPQSKPWVGLTNDEIALLNADYPHPQGFARAIEAKLREKNA